MPLQSGLRPRLGERRQEHDEQYESHERGSPRDQDGTYPAPDATHAARRDLSALTTARLYLELDGGLVRGLTRD
jgi:hypothetical protein